jgi:putative NADH-flavin reductase
MHIAVFGATGRTGRRVVRRALDAGHHVTAVVRTSAKLDVKHDRLAIERGDVTNYDSFADALRGSEAVVSVIGKESVLGRVSLYSEGTSNIIQAMNEHGVSRLIAISSGGRIRDGIRTTPCSTSYSSNASSSGGCTRT